MRHRFITHIACFGLLLSALVSFTSFTRGVSAVVDNTPDCDTVAIIRCGAFSAGALRQKAAQGDVPRVFNALGISQDDLKGEFVSGTVWRDGRVTVEGKTVATDAMTAGRNFGGTPIPNTNNAGTYPTSKFVTEGQTAFVKMKSDGTFDFAVIKSCGNPISATPKKPETPPAPQPTPKNIRVCRLSDFTIVTIKDSQFDNEKYSKDLEKCKIKVCRLADKTIVTINKSDFDSKKYSKNLNDCKQVPPAPHMIQVCELSTKNLITIKETDFDSAKHSKDLNDCAKVLPAAVASTGPEAILSGLFGSSALGYGTYSYLQSRRQLLSKFLRR